MSESPTPPAALCRCKLLKVTREAFAELFKAGAHSYMVIDNPLPDDARVTEAVYDISRGVFVLKVESARFPAVAEGCCIPDFGDIRMQRVVTAGEVESSRN